MQPYFFPYIGYFQLIHAADVFVIYDDVNFMKKGWINRNILKVNGEDKRFTFPIEKVSQNKKIMDLKLAKDELWWTKFSKNLELNFSYSPFYQETMDLYNAIKDFPERNLAAFVGNSIVRICTHLNLSTKIVFASEFNILDSVVGESRIMYICKQLGATTYINAINGQSLYSKPNFAEQSLELKFIKLKKDEFINSFDPYLSTLQALMEFGKKSYLSKLNCYELI